MKPDPDNAPELDWTPAKAAFAGSLASYFRRDADVPAAVARRMQETADALNELVGEECPERTGRLKRSRFTRATGPGEHDVGVSAPYGADVELGTSKRAADPFLRRALARLPGRVRRIWGGR